MRKQIFAFFVFAFFSISFTNTTTVEAQTRPYTATNSQVQYLLNRIETRTDTFKREVNAALDRSTLNNTDAEDMIANYMSDFESATDALKQKFTDRDSVDADVEDVLNRASYINGFLQTNRLTTAVQTNWNYIRTDLNTLARYYGISWNWSNPSMTTTPTTTTVMTNTRPYRVTDTTVQALLSRIETRTDAYKRTMNRALDRSAMNNTDDEDNVFEFITEFENATDRLKQKFDSRQSVGMDVSDVLNRAASIENFMRGNRLTQGAQRDWTSIRTDLDTLAGYYNVTWNWSNPPTNTTIVGNTGSVPYRVSDTNVRTLLTRLETNSDNYRRQINADLDRSILNNSRNEDAINGYISEFENAVDSLKQKFDSRRSVGADVENVLTRAYAIDSFMRDYRFTAATENQWKLVRTDLDTLSNYYSVTWNWNRQYQPPTRFDEMLTGTYRLNVSQSDNVSDIISRATTTYYQGNQSDRVRNNLERRLTPPDMLAVQKSGNQVTIASSTSPQVTFNADGTTRTETNANGRQTKITASTYYDGVALNYEGERANDFYVNFTPMSNGQLRVVRRVYLENRNDTVTVASVYDKTGNTAQWSITDGNMNNNTGGTVNNTFVIPNNTKLTAVLTSPISTKTSQNGDRFTMRVNSGQYEGAIIEGRVARTERSGRVSGRAAVSLEFDTIAYRNQTYRFAGIVDQVKLANGENITVTNEGTVRDNNQTTRTATRAGIGAAIGALIGAIAGGGQGAVIGAGTGAGVGVGSVILQGRNDIELADGTEFMITATAPANVSGR